MNALSDWPHNRLLLALPSRNLKRLMPELEQIRCQRAQVLMDADSSLDHVFLRLIEEFHARLRDVPHTWIEWSCSQLLQNTPLHPIAESVRRRLGSSDLPAEQRLAELENSLSQVKLDPVENATLLAPLLDIPLPSERAPALAPEELRRRQLAALTVWVLAGARAQPLVLAVEDAHWADPTTLDLLRGIAERGALAPLFVVATARPEFRAPWSTRSQTPWARSFLRLGWML